jgi:Zn-dependent protease with chaperone function
MITASDFIHPEDAAALEQLESIPGFPAFVKKILELGLEQMQYGINMASAVRLSPTQLPHLYNRLPPICEKLGIEEPEFYRQMNPMPNAWTFGDTKTYITITSGLVETMTERELDAVIAHECGHILCRHVLYHSIANYILRGIDSLGVLGACTVPIQFAILYWYRKSELSCDRVGAFITDPETAAYTEARLAGGPTSITKDINLEEWARQADAYEEIRTDGLWNKALQVYAIAAQTHPFSAVRVREVLKWSKTDQYKRIVEHLNAVEGAARCKECGNMVSDSWAYCKYCGKKLK